MYKTPFLAWLLEAALARDPAWMAGVAGDIPSVDNLPLCRNGRTVRGYSGVFEKLKRFCEHRFRLSCEVKRGRRAPAGCGGSSDSSAAAAVASIDLQEDFSHAAKCADHFERNTVVGQRNDTVTPRSARTIRVCRAAVHGCAPQVIDCIPCWDAVGCVGLWQCQRLCPDGTVLVYVVHDLRQVALENPRRIT